MVSSKDYKTVMDYLPVRILEAIAERSDNRSGTIARDLERLYTLYRYELREVPLTKNEAMLIVDALNGVTMDAVSAGMLWAEVEDAIRENGLDKKWEVDGRKLLEKLLKLNRAQALALIDAAERYWRRNGEEPVEKFFVIQG